MQIGAKFEDSIRALVRELVKGHFEQLARDGRSGRLSAKELKQALNDYGRRIVDLPDEAFGLAEVYPIQGQQSIWAVDLPLWTAEEGRSDLTLSLTINDTPEGVRLEIDDLHVL